MDNFKDALKGAVGIESKVKDLIAAAEQGELGIYKNIIGQLDFGSIKRDYAMVLIIFSPIVAVIKAAEKQRDDTDSAELERRVNAVLSKQKFQNLCIEIGEGDGGTIGSILDSFKNYKELLQLLSGNRYGRGGSSDKFMIRALKITPWSSANKNFISTRLVPFVRDNLGAKFSSAFGQGLRHASEAPAAGPAAADAAATTTATTTTTTSSFADEPEHINRVYSCHSPLTSEDIQKLEDHESIRIYITNDVRVLRSGSGAPVGLYVTISRKNTDLYNRPLSGPLGSFIELLKKSTNKGVAGIKRLNDTVEYTRKHIPCQSNRSAYYFAFDIDDPKNIRSIAENLQKYIVQLIESENRIKLDPVVVAIDEYL